MRNSVFSNSHLLAQSARQDGTKGIEVTYKIG